MLESSVLRMAYSWSCNLFLINQEHFSVGVVIAMAYAFLPTHGKVR